MRVVRWGVSLSEVQWARIEPSLPDRTPRRGGRWRDHRQVIDATVYKYRTGFDYSSLFPQTDLNQTAAAALAAGIQTTDTDDDDEDASISDVDDSSDPKAEPSDTDTPDTDD
ncbi:transposase [Streptomyces roseolus]|uniref:transposase n=1 Tax=Streptomyces roseolus TaxID=67358 RepID=UPI0036F69EE4